MPSGSLCYIRLNSPFLTPSVKAVQSARLKLSLGPSGSLESRTATTWGIFPATSTHAPPFPWLWLLLLHAAATSTHSPPFPWLWLLLSQAVATSTQWPPFALL